ncbi:MAG TPA: hypothetical protein VG298_14860 [Acidimicrobiales bacterium]|jgi:hypothetical protein|nr:hypothetical protein [Acidimicrobiales bacterium]
MNDRKLTDFVDALAEGRRPPGDFEPDQEDVDVLRMAIALSAARPGDASPDEEFVAQLQQNLADQSIAATAPNVHALKRRRARAAVVAVAASLALIGGTFAVTEATTHSTGTTAAVQLPHGKVLRTGTFESKDGRPLGQIVVYNGDPSWVYMSVGLAQTNGTIMCKLQLDNGSIVAAGTIELHHGTGQLSKTVRVDTGRLRGATLYNSSGAVVGLATLA